MRGLVPRNLTTEINKRLQHNPVVAILGQRQRVLMPDAPNLKKRLVKSPKIYIRDSDILHALLDICRHDDLLSHPVVGDSFEGFAMENILTSVRGYEPFFYRTGAGAEIDLILRRGRRVLALELKSSTIPSGYQRVLECVGRHFS